MNHKPAVFELNNVCFEYPDGSAGLTCCSVSFHKGGRTAILGINGSGKTTLLLHLIGILRPRSGAVLYDGAPLSYSRQALHELRSRVGFVFQNPDSQLFSSSVREDVSFGPMNQGIGRQAVAQRVAEALRRVSLTDCADKPVHALSHGQKKRACLAGALAMEPEMLILDEPMAGLDRAGQQNLEALLCRLHAEGLTIILSTHDIDFAYRWADRCIVLDQGGCRASCAAEGILEAAEPLQALGIGLPEVLRLHLLLARQGVVPATGKPPRSVAELLEGLERQRPSAQCRP